MAPESHNLLLIVHPALLGRCFKGESTPRLPFVRILSLPQTSARPRRQTRSVMIFAPGHCVGERSPRRTKQYVVLDPGSSHVPTRGAQTSPTRRVHGLPDCRAPGSPAVWLSRMKCWIRAGHNAQGIHARNIRRQTQPLLRMGISSQGNPEGPVQSSDASPCS